MPLFSIQKLIKIDEIKNYDFNISSRLNSSLIFDNNSSVITP